MWGLGSGPQWNSHQYRNVKQLERSYERNTMADGFNSSESVKVNDTAASKLIDVEIAVHSTQSFLLVRLRISD